MLLPVRPEKVLIVDDDHALLLALPDTLLLRLPHLSVESLDSSEEALNRLSARRYSVLVADLKMPRIDGLTLMRTVKTLKREVPVVIMSGDVDRPTVEQLLAEGADDVIPKPFDRVEFAHVVEAALQRRRLARKIKAIKLSLHHVGERSEYVNVWKNSAREPPNDRHVHSLNTSMEEQLKASEVNLLAARERARDQTRQRLYKSL